jgi:hypothetical protein
MPWRQETMKDVASCDKPRGAASELRSEDLRMGQPGRGHARSSCGECITARGERGEVKYLSTPRKRNQLEIPLVATSERGGAQTGEM